MNPTAKMAHADDGTTRPRKAELVPMRVGARFRPAVANMSQRFWFMLNRHCFARKEIQTKEAGEVKRNAEQTR